MKSSARELLIQLPWLVVAYLAFGAFANGQEQSAFWRHYNPQGSVNGQGILQEVLTRCDAQGRQNAYEPDLVTYCHEATHQLNGRIRNTLPGNWNAFYVGGDNGLCAILPEPRVTLEQAAQFVPQNLRTDTFQLYFVQMSQYWNNQPLYILDEWVAYTNGAQAAKELRVDPHGTNERAVWFCTYADCVLRAVETYDPSYTHTEQLREFIRWHKGRVNGLTGQQIAGYTAPQAPAAQMCVNGQCGRPQHVVTWVPANQNPPQPVKPPTVQAASYTDPRWTEWRNKIEAQIAAIKPCQCDQKQQVTVEVMNEAIATAVADNKQAEVDCDKIALSVTNALSQKFEQRFVSIEQKIQQPAPPAEQAGPQIFYDIAPRTK